jgi:hypothetical protein
MNEGVKILIERMKTNPEEFVDKHWSGESKWGGLINSYRNYLDIEDLAIFDSAYTAAISKLMQQRFTEDVMTELLNPQEDDSLGKPWYIKQNVMPLGGTTRVGSLVGNVNSIQQAQVQHDSTVAHMEAHLEALRKGYETPKKHQTLFGKLFNYS